MSTQFFGNVIPPTSQGQEPTGEISAPTGAQFSGLKLNRSKKLSTVAGENATAINLKDHPEMDGQTVALVSRGSVRQGETGDYIVFPVILLQTIGPDEYKPTGSIVIMTGSANVMERVRASGASLDEPVIATFRAGGRAWFLD